MFVVEGEWYFGEFYGYREDVVFVVYYVGLVRIFLRYYFCL